MDSVQTNKSRSENRTVNSAQNMTTGDPAGQIIVFAVPMLLGSIFQQVYNFVDTFLVGKYLGETALAGVGATGTLTLFLFSLIYGFSNGAGLIIAQCFGAGQAEKMKSTIRAMIWTMGLLTLFNTVIGTWLCPFFIRLLAVPEDCFAYSVPYLRVLYVLCFGSVLYNGTASILRSVGDSRTPLYCLVAASFVNVLLDLLFILTFHLGVFGAALATALSQILSGFLCLIFTVQKMRQLHVTLRDRFGKLSRCPKRKDIWLIVKTGTPSAFQTCMIALGGMSVQRLVNSFGAPVMAAYTAAGRIDSIAIQVIVSLGTSLSVFTGQNIGAGNFRRIQKGLRQTLVMELISAGIIGLAVNIFRYPLLSLFLDRASSPEAISYGASYLSIIGTAYLVSAVMQSYQNVIRGAGDVNICMAAGITELTGRIIFAYLLAPVLGPTGIWIATPLSWSCGCAVPVVRYYSGRWRTKLLL